jgi:hypothetical protein
MSEENYNEVLNEARSAKKLAEEAYDMAEKVELNILHKMELEHIKITNQVDRVSTDVKIHRSILTTIAGVIGLAVLTAILKGVGL